MHQGRQESHTRHRDPFSQMMFGPPRPPMQQAQQYQQQYHPQQQQVQHIQQPQQQTQHTQYPHPQQQPFQNQPQFPQHMGTPMGHQGAGKKINSKKMMSYITKEDGTLDYAKIGNGFQQVYGIAGQVTPMIKKITPFITKFIAK
ncbi:hypothetical protein [Evansella cellulosilytica]|uniref:YppG-like protein n=1 Tax=Evansella cellulosilytica (strain ATCC 21833 / DSM 2522 / FERM P-1141 / JCM 9156 / N-4) TaxID=649639 RepID=E6TYT0_EVAC2|nr:hypothetical protein [Evansella cellulosilytica]ADU31265.1 hypothetical protein Bcell_3015 [Evansella cellulosilytica DSM 2522]